MAQLTEVAPLITAPAGMDPVRILVVDDNATNRKLIQAILKREGFELIEASDGATAIRLARELHPNLVLLDVMMPEQDGYEVCKQLKRDPATAETPVIFLSAKALPSDRVRGLELGAVDYVTKPFSRHEILARVRTHLENRILHDSLRRANEELREKQRKIDEGLVAAALIQRSLLPADEWRTRQPEAHFGWCFLPSERVGGDVFNIHRLDPDHVGIYVLDVAGHGVAAAMVAVSVAQRMNPQSGSLLKERLDTPPFYRVREPEGVLAGLDADFPIERFGRFFTMSYVLLNLRTGRLRHASAGHPQPIVQRRTGELVFLDASGVVGLGGVIPFRGGEVSLQPGDRLFVYTDGIADAGVTHGERFGVNRLERVLGRCAERPIQSACDDVLRAVVEFAGGTRSDDVTFVGMEFRGSERRTARGAAA